MVKREFKERVPVGEESKANFGEGGKASRVRGELRVCMWELGHERNESAIKQEPKEGMKSGDR